MASAAEGDAQGGTSPAAQTPSNNTAIERAATFARRYWPAFVVLALLIVALCVRLYRLDSVPGNVTADEADFFQEVYRVLEVGAPSWFYQGQPASLSPLGIRPMAWSVQLFGDDISGLRMYSVILSLATLVPFFVLARHRFSFLTAVTATLLLATNVWFLHFSRTAWANMNAALLATGVMCCLQLGLERGRWWWFVGAGVFIGFGPWAYVSARLLPFIAAAFFPIALFIYRDQRRRVLWGFGIAGIVALVIAAPVINKLLTDDYWDEYTFRSRIVSIFHSRPNSEAWDMVPEQTKDTAKGFLLLSNEDNLFRSSTESNRYAPRDGDLVDPIARGLFYLGLVAAIWQWRKTALWWLVLLVPLSFQVFSVGTPDGARGLIVVPAIFLFVALGLETLVSVVKRWLPQRPALLAAGGVAVVLGAGALGVWNVTRYFDWMESDYALAERGPAVDNDEFESWSTLQRHAIAAGTGGFNVGTWRERQDRAGCLNGRLTGVLCEDYGIAADASSLGRTLVRPEDVPPEFTQQVLAEVPPEDIRHLYGGNSDALAVVLDDLDIEQGWAAVYAGPGLQLSASAALLATQGEAERLFVTKSALTGGAYLGGPAMDALQAPGFGDSALFLHFRLSGEEWWEIFWREGRYIAQVQLVYIGQAPPDPPITALVAAARAQADRLAYLATLTPEGEPPPDGGEPPAGQPTPTGPAPTPPPGDSGAQRDALRAQHLEQIAAALAEYRDEHDSYPATGGGIQTLCVFPDLDAGCALEEVLSPLPQDPLGSTGAGGYWYASDGTTFSLYTQRESEQVEECPEHPPHLADVPSLICASGP